MLVLLTLLYTIVFILCVLVLLTLDPLLFPIVFIVACIGIYILIYILQLVFLLSSRSQKRYTKLLMDTLSMLFGICGMEEQSLRLAASETLNMIVKATYLTHITRIQMTAFNEMKKVIEVFLTLLRTLFCVCTYVIIRTSHTHIRMYVRMYSEYLLIRWNSFSKNMVD